MNDAKQSIVGDFTRREKRAISKRDFPALINRLWQQYKEDWGKAGFRKAGIVPFDPTCISP